jgi:nicotinamide mononucleotide transporter
MILDALGAGCDLLSTWYFIRLNIKAWPIGLFATILNGCLYWQAGLFADTLLSCFYLFSFCYGWYAWNKPQNTSPYSSQPFSAIQWTMLFLGWLVLFSLLFIMLKTMTTSNVPILDSLTTSMSLYAQWLMGRKMIVTWILWFFVDVLYMFLYLNKALYYHVLLMLVYTGLAVIGYMHWRQEQNEVSSSMELGLIPIK